MRGNLENLTDNRKLTNSQELCGGESFQRILFIADFPCSGLQHRLIA